MNKNNNGCIVALLLPISIIAVIFLAAVFGQMFMMWFCAPPQDDGRIPPDPSVYHQAQNNH